MNRRKFISATAAAAATVMLPAQAATSGIKAVAFDGLALFDPRPIFALAEQFFPGRGNALATAWRVRIFEYSWLRTLTGSYATFMRIADDALVFALAQEKITATEAQRKQLVAGFLDLRTWPDVAPVLRRLKAAGLRLAPLTHFSVPMLEKGMANSGLEGVFDHLLSADLVKAYKPDPRAYQMAVDRFGLAPNQIAFVAFGGWDAAGAKTFGFPTIWINRLNAPAEQLGVAPDAIASSFDALPAFVGV
ncbi:haloacid dehalogenase type II [Pseudoduganella eburnea]|uniref:(S)-2-haloacid dehalogenase n=1 Tax=Massilia eburnea TaxID=1776165 RepID=A0A6L6QEL0_9BURK|nr:haloacid dehalogenase type II [Massilia eburnea]MTW10591.1 haloacid dehalogenase type II [Massilia eburnea]